MFDISRTRTSPGLSFVRFCEELDLLVKVQAAGLMHLEQTVRDHAGVDVLARLIGATGEPWGPRHVKEPAETIQSVGRWTNLMHVVLLFSALDEYIIGSAGTLALIKEVHGAESNNEELPLAYEVVKLANFANKIGIALDRLDGAVRILAVFALVRNCAAHRAGKASPALATATKDQSGLQETLARLRKRPETELPHIPAWATNDEIQLHPRHVILAVDMAHRLFSLIDGELVGRLGEGGVLRMAAEHSLLRADARTPEFSTSPEATVALTLTMRHRVDCSGQELIAGLREMGLWERCRAAYDRLRHND